MTTGRRPTSVPDAHIRPALERALAVARAGMGATPPVEPPRGLERVLSFRQLSAAAFAQVRRALEGDDGFRARVAEGAEEGAMDRASWLFLTRPEGWEAEIAALSAASPMDAGDADRERDALERQVRAAEEGARRAQAALADVTAEREAASEALAVERRARREASVQLEEVMRRLTSIERERDAAHRRASMAESALERFQREAASERPEAPAVVSASDDIRAAIERARAAAAELTEALDAAAGAASPPAPARHARDAPVGGAGPGRRPAGRLPAALPPGLFDDDPAAAEFLVRQPALILIVDGYNVSQGRWGDLPIGEQRARLVDALSRLAARPKTAVHVVFDGAGGSVQSMSLRRRDVNVVFSPEDVEADDVILELVDTAPLGRPVVVATDDRRVQRESRARGANVVSTSQLLVAAGSER